LAFHQPDVAGDVGGEDGRELAYISCNGAKHHPLPWGDRWSSPSRFPARFNEPSKLRPWRWSQSPCRDLLRCLL